MASELLPQPQSRLVDGAGFPMPEWYAALQAFAAALDSAETEGARVLALEAAVAALQAAVAALTPQQLIGIASVLIEGGQVRLRGDTDNPGALYGYGTNADGTKGWHQRLLATLADIDLTDLEDGHVLRWDATDELWKPAFAIEALVAGTDIAIDTSDPLHPVITATGGGGGGGGMTPGQVMARVAFGF